MILFAQILRMLTRSSVPTSPARRWSGVFRAGAVLVVTTAFLVPGLISGCLRMDRVGAYFGKECCEPAELNQERGRVFRRFRYGCRCEGCRARSGCCYDLRDGISIEAGYIRDRWAELRSRHH